MTSKIVTPFSGPLTPTAIEAWLGQCDDAFEIYAATKSEKAPKLELVTQIRLVGSSMLEPAMAAWWSAGRTEFLKLGSWEEFEKKIRGRFMPKGYKLIALRAFFCCAQGNLSFLDYAAMLADARNAVGTSVVSASVYKYQLLFHAHPMLILRIMAIPDFDIDSIGFDNLVALMSMQWDSLVAEGVARPPRSTNLSAPRSSATAVSHPLPVVPTPLTDAERDRLTKAHGCWRCRKDPSDPSFVPHVGRTCPGDPSQGISPGRDYVAPQVAVKKEYAGAVFSAQEAMYDDDGEDQPFYPDMVDPSCGRKICGYVGMTPAYCDDDTD